MLTFIDPNTIRIYLDRSAFEYQEVYAVQPDSVTDRKALSRKVMDSDLEQILACFHPQNGYGRFSPTGLALAARGKWLHVQLDGWATFGSEKGSFDVLRFENLVRKTPTLSWMGWGTSLT